MKTVRIQKANLVAIIIENANKHAREFVEAAEAWRVAQRDKLRVAAAALDNPEMAEKFNIAAWTLPKPEAHMVDYDYALKKLGLSADDVIELTDAEYRQFVADEWLWKDHFRHLVATYTSN